ncbi:redoxin domain-containing protein, partial [Nocardia farcinica]
MKTGQLAPQFELPDQSGTKRSLDELLADGPLVLFFYPAANTPVCTAEA